MEIAAAEPPGVNGITSQPLATPIDPAEVVEHLTSLLQITLDATLADLKGPGSLLSDKKKADRVLNEACR